MTEDSETYLRDRIAYLEQRATADGARIARLEAEVVSIVTKDQMTAQCAELQKLTDAVNDATAKLPKP